MVLHCILHFISLLSQALNSMSIKNQVIELHILRNKYQYLDILIIDEIPMIRRKTFGLLHLALKFVMENLSPFGGVSLLVVGDFLQHQPANEKDVFMRPSIYHICYSMDRCGKNSNCMSELKLCGRAVIQILLNYLIGF